MNTETIHILIAACTLIAVGIASFPYRLSYGNTSWLPWWMQPDSRYLERPYEYDYPARNINLLFFRFCCGNRDSVDTFRTDSGSRPTTYRQKDGLPPLHFFPCLCLLPGTFWRKDYGDGFCYAGRITSFSYGKVYTILLTACNHICPLPFGDIICLSWGEYALLSCSVVCSSYMIISGYSGFVATMNTVTR